MKLRFPSAFALSLLCVVNLAIHVTAVRADPDVSPRTSSPRASSTRSTFPRIAVPRTATHRFAISSNFQLVGQNPLFNRGMNAALAVFENFVYIGNRTDASSLCVGPTGIPFGSSCPHPHPGILIVDAANPSNPSVVGEIGPPFAGNIGITTRELRVWPDENLLIVMSFRCSFFLHACPRGTDAQFPFDIKFFDLHNPLSPRFISSYVPTSLAGQHLKPHEMFLWVDPNDGGRALLFLSTPTLSTNPARPNLMVVDISRVPNGGPVTEVAEGNWNSLYPGTNQPNYPFDPNSPNGCGPYDCNLFVHSMGVSADGKRTFLAMEAGHFLVLDTTSVANNKTPGVVQSLNGDLLTSPVNRPTWLQNPPQPGAVPQNCLTDCPNSHSAVQVPGRSLALTTDEVYGTYTDPSFGCPWGWERLIDISDATHPFITGEFKITANTPSFCGSPGDDPLTEQFTSYSSHNPTVLPDLAIVDWHSGGVQVSDISNPANPVQAGVFSPDPLSSVATEDPALSRGQNKVVMWSYPIISNGLIYVIDVRNGLFILRYSGPHANEVANIGFLEGNSNLGDALNLAGMQAQRVRIHRTIRTRVPGH